MLAMLMAICALALTGLVLILTIDAMGAHIDTQFAALRASFRETDEPDPATLEPVGCQHENVLDKSTFGHPNVLCRDCGERIV